MIPKYDLPLIDAMRDALYTLAFYDSAKPDPHLIELQLQTYIINGTPASDLVKRAAAVEASYEAQFKKQGPDEK